MYSYKCAINTRILSYKLCGKLFCSVNCHQCYIRVIDIDVGRKKVIKLKNRCLLENIVKFVILTSVEIFRVY